MQQQQEEETQQQEEETTGPMCRIDFYGHESVDLKLHKTCANIGCDKQPNGFYTCRCCTMGEGFWDNGDFEAYCSDECATLFPKCDEGCASKEDIVCNHCFGCTVHGCICTAD